MSATKFAFDKAIAAFLVAAFPLAGPARAQDPRSALPSILDAADRICSVVKAEGTSQDVTVTGEIRAEVDGLLKKLADLGISGQGSYTTDSYVGVLQADLPNTIKNISDCKLQVFNKLVDVMLPKSATPDKDSNTERESGPIFISLPPSDSPCDVNFVIEMAGKRIIPNIPLYRVSNIRLGSASWVIKGTVQCMDGSFCESDSDQQSGDIMLRANATYTFRWAVVPGSPKGSECEFSLEG